MEYIIRDIDQKLWRKIKALSALQGKSLKEWVHEALREKFQTESRQRREKKS